MVPRKFLTEEGCFLEQFQPLKIENYDLQMAFSCVLETPDFKISPTAATKGPSPGDTHHVIILAKTLQLWYVECVQRKKVVS